jgi:sugar phosphate isomerase/epimerase
MRQETQRMTYLVTKAMDSTRPCIDTSGGHHVITDIYDTHDYEQDVAVYAERYAPEAPVIWDARSNRQKYEGQPVFVSEYGGIGWAVDGSGWSYGTGPKTEEELNATVERMRKAGERCKGKGIQMLYHNHDFEFEKINGEYILDTYYAQIPADLLQTELDVCWVNVGGEEPAPYVRKYAGRAPLLHVKDFTGVKSSNMYNLIGQAAVRDESAAKFDYRPVGYGKQDVPAIVAAAEDAGVQWLIVEQDRCSMGRTALECAEMSVKYLKSFL